MGEDIKKDGLGTLIKKMFRICATDPNVVLPEDKIPEESKDNYAEYIDIVRELNNRGTRYGTLPPHQHGHRREPRYKK